MGKRGFKPKPLAIKKLHGSWRANVKPPEPVGDNTTPECPDWLCDEAKKKWFEVVAQLRRISKSLLSRIDVQMLSRYCTIWVLWNKARQFIEKNGEVMVLRDKDGVVPKGKVIRGRVKYVQQIPQAGLFLKYSQELRQMEAEFGMTPSARTKIGGEVKKEEQETGKAKFFKFQA